MTQSAYCHTLKLAVKGVRKVGKNLQCDFSCSHRQRDRKETDGLNFQLHFC